MVGYKPPELMKQNIPQPNNIGLMGPNSTDRGYSTQRVEDVSMNNGLGFDSLFKQPPPQTGMAKGYSHQQFFPQNQPIHVTSPTNIDRSNFGRFSAIGQPAPPPGPPGEARPNFGHQTPKDGIGVSGSAQSKIQSLFSPNDSAGFKDGVSNQSGIGNLLGGLQGSKYGDSYSLFGFPASQAKNSQVQGVGAGAGSTPSSGATNAIGGEMSNGRRPMEDHFMNPVGRASNSWNPVNGGGNNPLFTQPPPNISNMQSFWSGISPLEKLLESAKMNAMKNKPQQGFVHAQKDGQPP
jgi:hypothetical protein